jgi:hypothetical protein
MNHYTSKLLILVLAIVLNGCAASYKSIFPSDLDYTFHELEDGIGLSYKYNVLSTAGNSRYAGKESKKNIFLVAVKITNNTDSTIVVGQDALFYSGENQIFPLDPVVVKQSLKQYLSPYIPYLLLSLVTVTVSSRKGDFSGTNFTYPIGLFLGPATAFGNMAVANGANNDLLRELNEYNISNREIKKDETVYGIIGVRDLWNERITLHLKR